MKYAALVFLVGQSLLLSVAAQAGVAHGAGTWEGEGVSFDAHGKKKGEFLLEVKSTAVGNDGLKSEVTVRSAQGTKSYSQTLKDTATGFTIESTQGDGGGTCFGAGLCQAYIGTATHGYAITIVLDGGDSRRMLVTELKNGQAVGFVRESLEKK